MNRIKNNSAPMFIPSIILLCLIKINFNSIIPFSNWTVWIDIERDFGLAGSWWREPDLLTPTSGWCRRGTSGCWGWGRWWPRRWPCRWPGRGTEAVEISLHCDETMDAVSTSKKTIDVSYIAGKIDHSKTSLRPVDWGFVYQNIVQ